MFRSVLKVLAVVGLALAGPVATGATQPAEAEVILAHDDHRSNRHWRGNHHRHDRGHHRGWHRDWRDHSWHRPAYRPVWRTCYDRWGRQFACR